MELDHKSNDVSGARRVILETRERVSGHASVPNDSLLDVSQETSNTNSVVDDHTICERGLQPPAKRRKSVVTSGDSDRSRASRAMSNTLFWAASQNIDPEQRAVVLGAAVNTLGED